MRVRDCVRRGAVVAMGAVLVIAGGACGGGDDGSGSATDQREVEGVIVGLETALRAGDAKAVCAALTAKGQREMKATTFAGDGQSCEQSVAMLGAASAKAKLKQRPTKVLSVTIDGDTATAKISDAGRPALQTTLVRQDGSWKLDTLATGSSGG
jgi:hypothetical protein